MPRIIKPVSKGDIAVPTIQVDSSGRIFSASAGSAGGGGYAPTNIVNSATQTITNYSPASFYGIDTSDNGGGSHASGGTGNLYVWEDV